jgi:hypothetical protein
MQGLTPGLHVTPGLPQRSFGLSDIVSSSNAVMSGNDKAVARPTRLSRWRSIAENLRSQQLNKIQRGCEKQLAL